MFVAIPVQCRLLLTFTSHFALAKYQIDSNMTGLGKKLGQGSQSTDRSHKYDAIKKDRIKFDQSQKMGKNGKMGQNWPKCYFYFLKKFPITSKGILKFVQALSLPSNFFPAIQSYCSHLPVVLLSYDSRSTLFQLDHRKKIERANYIYHSFFRLNSL